MHANADDSHERCVSNEITIIKFKEGKKGPTNQIVFNVIILRREERTYESYREGSHFVGVHPTLTNLSFHVKLIVVYWSKQF